MAELTDPMPSCSEKEKENGYTQKKVHAYPSGHVIKT